jgi:hypothetical protein
MRNAFDAGEAAMRRRPQKKLVVAISIDGYDQNVFNPISQNITFKERLFMG